MLKLYGSVPSPFVRRIRILLANTEHEFISMQIFEGEDRAFLKSVNPTLKVPMLDDNGTVIYDSRVIYRYLAEKLSLTPLSWQQENFLTLIDSVNDTFVQLLIAKRSDMDVEEDRLLFQLHHERVETILSYLNQCVEAGEFAGWDYPEFCLYCLIDWIEFRELFDVADFAGLIGFQEKHKSKIEITSTDPRG